MLQEFLPQQLTAAEIAALIEQAIAESGAAVMADMGKVMAVLKPKIQGRADVGAVSAQVKPAWRNRQLFVWSKKPCFPGNARLFYFCNETGRLWQAGSCKSFIDDLLVRTDIVELIDSRVRLEEKPVRTIRLCCPFITKKPSFTVSQEKQFYHCFGCGAYGNAIGFVMEYDGLEFPDAIEGARQPARHAGAPRANLWRVWQ